MAHRLLPLCFVFLACGSGPSPAPATPTALVPIEPVASSEAAPVSSPAQPPIAHPPEELDPAHATQRAPDVFRTRFTTTKGNFVVEVRRSWAPNGADRFFNLVSMGVYDNTRFFRAIPSFMVQFGIPGDPKVASMWQNATVTDDPVTQSNHRGFVTFAQTGMPNSRTTQIFIDYGDNAQLDASNFPPFGKVTEGMDVVDGLYKGYGEGAPNGDGPSQGRIQSEGNAYLDQEFPKLDRLLSARIVPNASP